MAGFSTTSGGLNFQYPNRDTQNWDAVMANSFTTISSHDHSRDTAGRGAALTDRSILLDNAGWLQGANNAGSGTVNLIRATTGDKVEIGGNLNSIVLANDTYFQARNNADSGDVNLFKLTTSDALSFAQAATFDGTLTATGTLAATNAATVGTTLTVTGATTLSAACTVGTTLGVGGVATFDSNVQISANDTWYQGRNAADSAYINMFKVNSSDEVEMDENLDIKDNVIKTSTTNGDIELVPNGTGRVKLGDSGVRVVNGLGTNGHALFTDGTSAADFATLGYEVVDSTAGAGQAEILFDLSDYDGKWREWAIFMTGVGGAVSSYPTVELRTAASGAISCVFGRFDTAGFGVASSTAVYGSNTNGVGTSKHCFLAVNYNSAPNNVTTNIEGWFINTAGNNMPVFGQAGSIVHEIAFKNASGALSSTGTVYLLGRR
jgi:hypothetical protein